MYLVIEVDCVTKYLLIVLEGRTSARSVRHDQELNIFPSGLTKLSQQPLYHMTTTC